ncbi:alanyl-tRNA editing protein [Trinickia violacea]|uniref:Alanyl-tRNA editing protein n=1 Tax=Trinickia violacea TaxID=2571746 RepID=A0A4P8IZ51_9BURK|nr:alanyl-tRNA editing protein [Trinickia violacea]QCP54708.1 alanyl-tRNA editing protein [Trinickia violacea]
MTERHYLHSDKLEMHASVVSCSPAEDGTYQIVLSATLFHPQGGGQPSDLGTIADAKVIRVSQAGDDVIHHCDRSVAAGDVDIKVSAEPRALHARLHSAGHLISYCGEPFGWRAVKGHHWPGEARVIFEAEDGAPAFTADAIEQQANAQIASDAARHVSQEGETRKVGFGHLPAYPCGGTHVASLGIVGRVRILKVKEKKGQLWVHYDVES